jgi:archaellum biogenesis ATPase FlaH
MHIRQLRRDLHSDLAGTVVKIGMAVVHKEVVGFSVGPGTGLVVLAYAKQGS